MAKDLKFQGAMILFGTVICFFVFIFVLRIYFLNEGFEVIQKNTENPKCPASHVMVIQSISEKKNNVACYPDGLVNVDKVFMDVNEYVRIMAPKGSLVTLFAGINGTGATVGKISDLNNPAKINNAKFKSIRVELKPEKKPSDSCKPLSPAAKAAADAADAATAAAANAAAKAVGVDPKNLNVSGKSSVFSVSCPSGEPTVAFGSTKPISLDSQLGKFGGAGVKRKVDFSMKDDRDLVGADYRNECNTADSQPAEVDSACSLKPVRSSCGTNGYAFDPETEY
jgi:hypothetical protein